MQERNEKINSARSNGNNTWRLAKPHFHNCYPQFRSLSKGTQKITNTDEVMNTLADYSEKHFSEPIQDTNNQEHLNAMEQNRVIDYIHTNDSTGADHVYRGLHRMDEIQAENLPKYRNLSMHVETITSQIH
jgi:hypothetical protein